MEMDTMQQAAVLYTDGESVTLTGAGKKVRVYKARMNTLPIIIEFLNKMYQELGVDTNGNVSINLQDTALLLKLIAKIPQDFSLLLSNLSDLTVPEINELDLGDALQLTEKVVEINRGFFTERVLPTLTRMIKTNSVGLLEKS